jgi:excisionase family DNA binding protein
MKNENLQILTVKQVCALLNCSVPTIYRWREEGKLPFPLLKIGPRKVGFRKSDVERYINEQVENDKNNMDTRIQNEGLVREYAIQVVIKAIERVVVENKRYRHKGYRSIEKDVAQEIIQGILVPIADKEIEKALNRVQKEVEEILK